MNAGGYSPMTEETIGGATASNASHCATNSGGVASPASLGTSGPHLPRNLRTLASCAGLRWGGGSGTHKFKLNRPLLFARTSAAHATISSGCIKSAPHAPKPPALATAIDKEGELAPAMGPSKIGTWSAKRRQKVSVRSKQGLMGPPFVWTGIKGSSSRESRKRCAEASRLAP